MKNPNITNKLVQMMEQERRVKLQLIEAIINHTLTLKPESDRVELFNDLYDLTFIELNTIMDDIINEITANINRHIAMALRFGGLEE